jgi:hypothetical protein
MYWNKPINDDEHFVISFVVVGRSKKNNQFISFSFFCRLHAIN